MKKFFLILSYILHPLIIPFLIVYIYLNSGTYISFLYDISAKRSIYLFIFLNTIVLPVLFLLLLKKFKFIADIYLRKRKERFLPYFFIFIFYSFTIYIFKKISFPFIFFKLFGGILAILFLVTIINLKWKISIHTAAWGGAIAALFYFHLKFSVDLFFPLILFIFCAGLISTARLYLKEHSNLEIYAGIILGFLTQFVFMYYV